MKYAVIVIFKNGMKLDKIYHKKASAYESAKRISDSLGGLVYFANTFFDGSNVLCVTWQEVKENEKVD